MSKGQTLQDPFLNSLRKDRIPVSIFLVNGIKLQGQIESFDQYVVLLKNTVSQMVYKHAISTVVPSRNPRGSGPASGSTGGYSTERTQFGTRSSFDNRGFGQQDRNQDRSYPSRGFNQDRGFSQDRGFDSAGGNSGRGFNQDTPKDPNFNAPIDDDNAGNTGNY